MVSMKSLIPTVLCLALISEALASTTTGTTTKLGTTQTKLPTLATTTSTSSSSSSVSSSKTKSGSSSSGSSSSLPTVSSSSSSSSSSSTHYTFTAVVPTDTSNNPYIQRTTSPNGTIFISIGSVIGAIIVGFFGFSLLALLASRMRNSSNTDDLFDDYEDKSFGYDPSIFGRSTILNFDNEKKSSAASMYSYGGESSNGSNFLLLPGPFDDNVLTQQGRPLMNALLQQNNSSQALNINVPNNKSNRKSRTLSMYISPLEQAMNQSQLGLQPPNSTFDPNTPISNNSPISSNFPSSTTQNSPAISSETKEKKKVRPPSLYLDDLMDSAFDNEQQDDL